MQKMKIDDDHGCFVCGENNDYGLKLSFKNIDGKVVSEFTPSKTHQGYKDITHGGIITAVLDETMIQAAISKDIKPVTAEITVRFKAPLATGEKAVVEAEIRSKKPRFIEAYAKLYRKSDGSIIAEAFSKLIPSK
ncbi:MAG: PaaI family thioesterase [Nitrospiraceae bacterium]|nr:PaaI family thioesterase [Nitrospiraceae bacterium]